MTDLIQVNTADLTGAALDWMVAQVEAVPVAIAAPHYGTDWRVYKPDFGGKYSPSTDWAVGGPLIAKLQVALIPEAHDGMEGTEMSERWYADVYYDGGEQYTTEHCDTALIAACRAIVATKFGDSIQVPRELLP
ncbi:phage protein NinX family protein [Pseudomonas sp. AL 58]|uniref:phage protein NinX family protein n=1 Tax=Pseudomonas sp. AL 58 TaxID=3104275 RepID=UPI002EBAA539|nr:phage protein NinX family protein [Pseudomonas sp. AL 58]